MTWQFSSDDGSFINTIKFYLILWIIYKINYKFVNINIFLNKIIKLINKNEKKYLKTIKIK